MCLIIHTHSSGLLRWYWDNFMIFPVPMKQPWGIRVLASRNKTRQTRNACVIPWLYVIITSLLRNSDIATWFWRNSDAIFALCPLGCCYCCCNVQRWRWWPSSYYQLKNIMNYHILSSKRVYHIDGLVQNCNNSSAWSVELLQSCTKPSILPCSLSRYYHGAKYYYVQQQSQRF